VSKSYIPSDIKISSATALITTMNPPDVSNFNPPVSPMGAPLPAAKDLHQDQFEDASPTTVITYRSSFPSHYYKPTSLSYPMMPPEHCSPDFPVRELSEPFIPDEMARQRLILVDRDDTDDYIVVGCDNVEVCLSAAPQESGRESPPGFKRRHSQMDHSCSIKLPKSYLADNISYVRRSVNDVQGCFRRRTNSKGCYIPFEKSGYSPCASPTLNVRLNDLSVRNTNTVHTTKNSKKRVGSLMENARCAISEPSLQYGGGIPRIHRSFQIGSSWNDGKEIGKRSATSSHDYSDVDQGNVMMGTAHKKQKHLTDSFLKEMGNEKKEDGSPSIISDPTKSSNPYEWLKIRRASTENVKEVTNKQVLSEKLYLWGK